MGRRLTTACARTLLALVLLLALPAVAQAQFLCATNLDGVTLTITGYSGSSGALDIPTSINGLTVTDIGNWAFEDRFVTSVTIPDRVTHIGTGAFDGCSELTSVTIPGSVTTLGSWAFQECSGLTSVTIPGGVTNIGTGPFAACQNLTAMAVDPNNAFYSSVNGVLFDKTQTALIQYPGGLAGDYTIPGSVATIGDEAFENCYGLTSVTIPGNATNVGSSAFSGCFSLTNVALSNGVATIGTSAFDGCRNLTSVTIPGSVTDIGPWAFNYCSSLTSVVLSNGVTIGSYAFQNCFSLTNLVIANGVATIGDGAFYDCLSLTSVTIPVSVTNIGPGAFNDFSSLNSIYFLGNAPNADSSAFSNDDQLTVYYLPGATGWGAFLAGRPSVLWDPTVQTGSVTVGSGTNGFGFSITSTNSLVVVVEACTNLANPSWHPVRTNTLTASLSYFNDPQWTNFSARYYRLHWP